VLKISQQKTPVLSSSVGLKICFAGEKYPISGIAGLWAFGHIWHGFDNQLFAETNHLQIGTFFTDNLL
jgi:hypothetical protein